MSASDHLGLQWKGHRTAVGTVHSQPNSKNPQNLIMAVMHNGKKKWKVVGGLGDGTMHKTLSDAKQHVDSLHRRSQ
jgi:hypothetical protein